MHSSLLPDKSIILQVLKNRILSTGERLMNTKDLPDHRDKGKHFDDREQPKLDGSGDDSALPTRIVFQVFNTKTHELEPYGSMRWNGEEWEVEEENRFGTMRAMTNEVKGFGGRILTKKDRDFYMPFWHTPTTGWRVDVYPVPVPYRKGGKDKSVSSSK
jgi:hypothetical protein